MPSPHPLPRALLHPRHWPAWIGIALLLPFALVPLRLAFPLGRAIGALAFHVARRRRRIATRNLEICLPELDAQERERLLRGCFASIGIGLFEFPRAWWGRVQPIVDASTFEGIEHIENVRAQGRGVLLLSGHFLTLEMGGRLLATRVRMAGMYRRHMNPVLEWVVKRSRLRYGEAMFAREEVRPAVRYVKHGGVLWYAPDQYTRGKDAVYVPFFGVPSLTITATHQFARMTGATVIPYFHRRRKDRPGYEVSIRAPLENFPSDDPVADSLRINQLVEQMVREAPDEYLWIHRRFKRQPEGAPKLYDDA